MAENTAVKADQKTAATKGKQKFTEKKLKELGLDPTPYGYKGK